MRCLEYVQVEQVKEEILRVGTRGNEVENIWNNGDVQGCNGIYKWPVKGNYDLTKRKACNRGLTSAEVVKQLQDIPEL